MHRVADANGDDDDDDDDEDDDARGGYGRNNLRLYLCSVFGFVVLFTVFSLILWGSSKGYEPKISVQHIVFHSFTIQAGIDNTGVPTDMLSLNSTVRMFYRNPATFFGVHVSSTPFELHYYELKVGSGHMKEFYESRKSERHVVTMVLGHQVPLYGGVSVLGGAKDKEHQEKVAVPLNLTIVLRSRAHILGKLVKSKFYKGIRCLVTLRGNKIGNPQNLAHSCIYQ